MFDILIVSNDRNTASLLSDNFKKNGYKTSSACDGEAALNLLYQTQADLIISELILPKMSGPELIQSLHLSGFDIPVIIISGHNSIEAKRQAFGSGADDFLTKPVNTEELILRTRAVLRRCRLASEHIITVNETTLDYKRLCVSCGEQVMVLPKKEFYLLFKLLSSFEQIFTREQIMDEIWGMDSETDSRTVDVHIRRLRRKLDGFDDFKIICVRGIGYKAEKNIKKDCNA